MVTPRPLNVLELLTVPMDFSGLPAFALRTVRRMNASVHADFLSYHVGDERVREEIEAIGSRLYLAPSRLRHPIRYIRYTSNLIRENGYSVVHVHGNSCTAAIDLLAAKLGGAKVRIAHSHNSTCRFTLLHRLLRPAFNRLYTCAFACGEEAGRWMFGRKPFTVIPNAIDTRHFAADASQRTDARAEFGFGDALVLGHVGNYVPAKNPLFLLEVLQRVLTLRPDAFLLLVGDGPLLSEVKRRAEAMHLTEHLRLTGARTDMPRLYQAMDALLLPSLFEGFPTVALEAQCSGLPVVLSDAITRDCAMADNMFYQPLDADRWAEILLGLPPIDRAPASEFGVAAVAREGYDLAQNAMRLQAAYLELAAHPR